MTLPPLPENKSLKLAIFVSGAFFVLVLFILLSAGDDTQPAFVGTNVVEEQAPPPAPPNTDNSQIILELFNPSNESLGQQLAATNVYQQIEQAITVNYVLTKCFIISQDDYRDTFRALTIYARLTKLAPDEASASQKVLEIAESARASYALIYGRTSCSAKELPQLAKELSDWTTLVFSRAQ